MSPNHHGTPSTHLTLLAGVRGGEEEAWTRFFHRYGHVILQWSGHRGLQQVDSEDILQAFMKDAPRKLATYNREGEDGSVRRFGPWLRTVVGHLVADRQRDQKRKPAGYGEGGDDRMTAFGCLTTEDSAGIADAVAAEHSADVKRVVAAVQERLRGKNSWAVYQARELEGQPVPQVAQAYGISVGAVSVAVNRVNKMLAEEYQKLFPERRHPAPEKPHDVPG